MEETPPTAPGPRLVDMFGQFGVPVLVASVLVIGILTGVVTTMALSGSSGQRAAAGSVAATTSRSSTAATQLSKATHRTTPAPGGITTTTAQKPSTPTGPSKSEYASDVDAVCQQYVPQLTAIVSTGIDGAIFHETEVKDTVATMLSDVNAIPAPSGDSASVSSWITDWEGIWSAALSENTDLFTSEVRAADSVARQLGLSADCM